MSDREIGDTLFISPRTASKHVGNILSKLGLESRSEASAYAVRHGLG
jgi:DNA-binding CsgD family transcriptional regulator